MEAFIKDALGAISTFGPIDLIDIIVVAFIIYYAILLARETRAMQLVKSIGVVLATYFLAANFGFSTLEFILKKILDIGIIVLVVLFQPELRRALERIGRSKLVDIGKIGKTIGTAQQTEELINIICGGADMIIAKNEGALIVIERNIKLGDIIDTGTIIDAVPSAELLGNIFFHNSPLHDGAVVIREGRLYSAGCYLPLSENMEIDKEMGTRHRAALGVSEVSDAITIVVSEERKTISVTEDSRIVKGLSSKQLRAELEKRLIVSEDDEKKKGFWIFGDKRNGTK